MVTRREIISGLQCLGLKQGDLLLVHSALSSFGRLEGGAETLITAIQELLTPAGLLMMPAFTYGRQPFRIQTTPSLTGRVSEVFRTFPKVLRSEHPTHSVVAWGDRADWIVGGHKVESAFSVNSPLHRLSESGGKILLVGVGHVANSILHVSQEIAGVAYLDRPKIVQVVESDGSLSTMKVRRAGCSVGFDKIGADLEQGEVRKTIIGNSLLQCFIAREVVDIAVELQRINQEVLLCDRQDCYACNEARLMIQRERA